MQIIVETIEGPRVEVTTPATDVSVSGPQIQVGGVTTLFDVEVVIGGWNVDGTRAAVTGPDIPISADAGNTLTLGTDDALFVPGPQLSSTQW